MLRRIIRPSSQLVSFISSLHLLMSRPQEKHLLRTVEALIVCERRKTLSALYRQWVEAPDVSAVADYFRESPWTTEGITHGLEEFTLADLLARAEAMGIEPIIYASLDDSTTHKDKNTSALEAVDVTFDHSASGKGLPHYCKGAVHVTLRVQIGPWGYTFSWRLYLRRKTVQPLNRQRAKGQRRRFKSKDALARAMLEAFQACLPKGMSCSTVGMRRPSCSSIFGAKAGTLFAP